MNRLQSTQRQPWVQRVTRGALILALCTSHAAFAASFYEDALRRYEARDYAGAVVQLKNALRTEPNKLAIQYQLGLALQQNGEVVAAEVAFKEALRLGISRSEVALPLARVLVAQGRQRDMLAHPQLQVSGLPPEVAQSLLLVRASAQTDLGDSRSALQAIGEARAINDRRADVWLAEAPVRIRANQLAEALQMAERGLAIAPNDAEAFYVRGSVHHVQGALDTALSDYAKALSINAGHVEALVARAGILVDLKQLALARQTLDQLRKAAPKEPRAAYLRALVAELDKKPAQTKAALLEVTQLLDPVPINFVQFRPQLLMLNGLAHYGLNELPKARQYLEALLKVQPGSTAVRLLARIHIREGHPGQAIPMLEAYLRRAPDDTMALTLMGSAYVTQGQAARANQYLQEALKKQDRPEYRAALGISLLKSGRGDDALPELEIAWKKDPSQIEVGASLAQLYDARQQTLQALAVARELIKRQPESPGLHHLLGDILARGRQLPAARQAFEKALSLNPKLIPAQLQLARLDIQAGQLPTAEQRLNMLLRDAPRQSEAMAEMARISERRGQRDEAMRWLLRARDASGPKDLRWNLALMELNLSQGNPQQALEEGKIALGKQTDHLQVLMLHAQAQLALGDAAGARNSLASATRIAEFNAPIQTEVAKLQLAANNLAGAAYCLDKALTGQPGYLPALALLVQVELRQGQLDKAEQRARQIIQSQPQKAVGHGLLGRLALARRQGPMALEAFRQAHKVEPSSTTTLMLMNALISQGEEAQALELGRKRTRQAPTDVPVQMALADLHARAGRYLEAASGYKTTLKLQPGHVLALNSLANTQLKLNDKTASQTAEAAYKLAPGNPLVIDTLGWALFLQGQTDKALPLLRDARLRAPGNPEIRYHLATVLVAVKRHAEAKAELREALKISPRFEGAPEAQTLLKSLP
jgi:cellulose synthase operon protein C